jgi:hypothetical protein
VSRGGIIEAVAQREWPDLALFSKNKMLDILFCFDQDI